MSTAGKEIDMAGVQQEDRQLILNFTQRKTAGSDRSNQTGLVSEKAKSFQGVDYTPSQDPNRLTMRHGF